MADWPSVDKVVGDILDADFLNGIRQKGLNSQADNGMGAHYFDVEEIAEPTTPGADTIRVFVNSADGKLSVKDSAGTVTDLAGGGGASFTRGASSSRPASGTAAGDIYAHTDEPYWSYWTGAAWQLFTPGMEFGTALNEPGLTGTWVNQGAATLVTSKGGLYMESGGAASATGRIYHWTAPATPWKATALVRRPRVLGSGFLPVFGLILRESSSGKYMVLGASAFGKEHRLVVQYLTATSTYNSEPKRLEGIFPYDYLWLRVGDDGTDISFEFSTDNQDWLEVYTETRGANFTTGPDQYGVGGYEQGSGNSAALHFLHLDVA